MRKSLLTLGLLIASNSAVAAFDSYSYQPNFSYDYVDAYIGTSPDVYGATFSASFYENTHFISHVQTDFDMFEIAAGFGIQAPISNWTDVTADIKAKAIENSDLDFGVEMNLGLRQWLTDEFEVGGKVGYDTINSDIMALAYARYYVIPELGFGAEVRNYSITEFYDYNNQLLLTARFNFN